MRLREADERFELAVIDTGAGIPEQDRARIFDRFHRVEGAQGRSHEGSGIGLAFVQELVKLHGGSIRVESIAELARHDVLVSLGHSDASYAEACAAVKAGARAFTHLYNAMSAPAGREPTTQPLGSHRPAGRRQASPRQHCP